MRASGKPFEVVKFLADLQSHGQVRDIRRDGRVFYRPALLPSSTRKHNRGRAPRPNPGWARLQAPSPRAA